MDLLTVLDSLSRGESVKAQQLQVTLMKGYVTYSRGKPELTPYGRSVMDTLAKSN